MQSLPIAKLLATAIVPCNKLVVRVVHIMHTRVDILLIANTGQNAQGDAYSWSNIELHVNYLGAFSKSIHFICEIIEFLYLTYSMERSLCHSYIQER